MKRLFSVVLVIAIIVCLVPRTPADLPNYNDGTTGTINVGNINVRTNVNAAAGVFTNSLTLNGSPVLTNVTGGGVVGTLITNGASISQGDIVAYGTALTNTAKATSANLSNAIGGSVYVPLGGATMTGLLTAQGNAAVPDLLIGAFTVSRGTLTHAAGNVIVDFAQTNRYWSCTITGNVTFVLTNASAGKWANLLLLNSQATNCTPTFNLPAGTTNWFGGAPSTLTAGTVGSLSYYCIDATTNSTKAAYAETQ